MILIGENEIGTISTEQFIKNKISCLEQLNFSLTFDLILDCSKTILPFEDLLELESLLLKKSRILVVVVSQDKMDFLPNEFNFPSKLLFYMQFDKPIISSVTKGVSPEFLEFLIPIEGDGVENFKKAISNFNDQSDENLKDRLKKQMILKRKLSKENTQKLLNEF